MRKTAKFLLLFLLGAVLFAAGFFIAAFPYFLWYEKLTAVIPLGLGLILAWFSFKMAVSSMMETLHPGRKTEEVMTTIYERIDLMRNPKVVAIGGGTGLSTLLHGLKKKTANITAVVTVADDGGSSGRLRKEMDILPPGDIRDCLVALADAEPLMRKLFMYRFSKGAELAGHSFGNLFIAAMTQLTGDFQEALEQSSRVLAIRGQVLPSTLERVTLFALTESGKIVKGESNIGNLKGEKIKRIWIEPKNPSPNPKVIEAIEKADAIIVGPGSLYTSILPNLLVPGIVETIRKSKAKKIFVVNVMTQPGETQGYTASMHVKAVYEHVGEGLFQHVIVNVGTFSQDILSRYSEEGAFPVTVDEPKLKEMGLEVWTGDMAQETDYARHNPDVLCEVIMEILKQK